MGFRKILILFLKSFSPVFLRLAICLQLIIAPFAYWPVAHAQGSEFAQVQKAFTIYSQQPFDEEEARKFLETVSQNKTVLESTPEGRSLISKANRARMLLAMKRNLDKCFGGDILTLEAAKNVFESAFNSNVDPDCSISSSAFEDLDAFTNDLEAWVAKDNTGNQDQRREDLRKTLFTDTALRAAEAEARLRYLFSDPVDVPGLLESMCGANGSKCPAEFVSQFRSRGDELKKRLTEGGYRPITDASAAKKLNAEVRKMYDSVYDPARSYHVAQTDPERWEVFRPEDGEAPEYFRPDGAGRLTFQPYPNALTQPGLTREEYLSFESELNADLERAIPAEFYEQQEKLVANQYGIALATNLDWMRTLGHGMTVKPIPMLWGQSGVMIGPVSVDRRQQETALPVHEYLSLITADSIKENRKSSLKRLNDTIGEMGSRIFSKEKGEAEDDLKKLFTANPRAAGELLLANPKNLDLYCETFQGIRSDENFDWYMSWGLLGITIGAAIVTGGASLLGAGAIAAAGGATLATVGAVDMVYGASQGMQELEMGQLQHAVCVSEGPESQACLDYQSQINSAMTSFAFAGVGALGMGPYMRTLGKLGRGTGELLRDSVATLPRVAEYLKGPGSRLLRGLTDEQKGALMAHLSQLSDGQRAALAARTASLSEKDLMAFNRRLILDLENGKSFDEIVSGANSKAGSSIRISGESSENLRVVSMEPSVLPSYGGNSNKPANPWFDVTTEYGRRVPGPNYETKLAEYAKVLEQQEFKAFIKPAAGGRNYKMLCIESGPKWSVIGRVLNSKGLEGTPICIDPIFNASGTYRKNENLITLSPEAFEEAISEGGFTLLHEVGHATALRRALSAAAKPGRGGGFIPFGRIGAIEDLSLVPPKGGMGLFDGYLSQGFDFDELHSFQRHTAQMTSALERGELIGSSPIDISRRIETQKTNAFVINKFSTEILDGLDTYNTKVPSSAGSKEPTLVFETQELVWGGKKVTVEKAIFSKPIVFEDGDQTFQVMEILIPPGPGSAKSRMKSELERLALRSKEIYEAALRQETRLDSIVARRPKDN